MSKQERIEETPPITITLPQFSSEPVNVTITWPLSPEQVQGRIEDLERFVTNLEWADSFDKDGTLKKDGRTFYSSQLAKRILTSQQAFLEQNNEVVLAIALRRARRELAELRKAEGEKGRKA